MPNGGELIEIKSTGGVTPDLNHRSSDQLTSLSPNAPVEADPLESIDRGISRILDRTRQWEFLGGDLTQDRLSQRDALPSPQLRNQIAQPRHPARTNR